MADAHREWHRGYDDYQDGKEFNDGSDGVLWQIASLGFGEPSGRENADSYRAGWQAAKEDSKRGR